MDQSELENDLRVVLSPTEWKSSSELKSELEALWRRNNKKAPHEGSSLLERMCNMLHRLEREGVVTSREGLLGASDWKLVGGSRGMPVEDLPAHPKVLTGGAAEPIPA